jgi:hypothetical protein
LCVCTGPHWERKQIKAKQIKQIKQMGSGGLGSARHELVEQLLEALIGQRLAAPSAAAAEIDALLVELLLELELVTLGGLSLLLL